jgi:hypothetical protein
MLGLPGIEGGDHIEFDRAVRDTERPAADSGRWGSTSRRWRRVWTVEETYCSEKSRSRLGSAGSRPSMDGAYHSLLHGQLRLMEKPSLDKN